jgi:hypothetical protein
MARAVAEEDAAAVQQELEAVKKRAAEQEAEANAKAAGVASKANKYARPPLPDLKGKADSAGKSMPRFLSAKETGNRAIHGRTVRGRDLGTVLPVEVKEAEPTAGAEANAAPAEAIRQAAGRWDAQEFHHRPASHLRTQFARILRPPVGRFHTHRHGKPSMAKMESRR